MWVPRLSPSPPHAGVAALTGMVWLPCSALMAACASAWEEYFTKAHPGWTGEAEPGPESPEGGQGSPRTERRGTGGAEGTGRIPEESRTGETRRPREKRETPRDRERPGRAGDSKVPLSLLVPFWTWIATSPYSRTRPPRPFQTSLRGLRVPASSGWLWAPPPSKGEPEGPPPPPPLSPLLLPSGPRRMVHSSMFPKASKRRRTSSSDCCLLSMPTKSFLSSGTKLGDAYPGRGPGGAGAGPRGAGHGRKRRVCGRGRSWAEARRGLRAGAGGG